MSDRNDKEIIELLRDIEGDPHTEGCILGDCHLIDECNNISACAKSYDRIKHLLDKRATADTKRLDWLADVNNTIGNVALPTECVQRNLSSLRDAIDDAMKGDNNGNG